MLLVEVKVREQELTLYLLLFFFLKQRPPYETKSGFVGPGMCIRDETPKRLKEWTALIKFRQ